MTLKTKLLDRVKYGDLDAWPSFAKTEELVESLEQIAARRLLPLRRALLSRLLHSKGGNIDLPWVPQTDVDETAQDIYVSVALPGVEKKDIHVTVSKDMVTVQGERRDIPGHDGHRRVEQAHGTFLRRLRLPAECKPAGTKASYANGLLQITLRKAVGAAVHGVKVE